MRRTMFNAKHPLLSGLGFLLLIQPLMVWAQGDASVAESLKQALEKQGWKAEQTESGDILYRKPDASTSKPQVGQGQKGSRFHQLRNLLEQRGWKAEVSADGDLLLWPRVPEKKVAATDAKDAGSAANASSATQPVADLPGFGYWKIEKSADGSLLFHPLSEVDPGQVEKAENPSNESACEAVGLAEGDITLPVNRWAEIKKVAKGWIKTAGLEKEAVIGKIRKIGRIYLFSVVGQKHPHKLKHQLSVRASDGCVRLLD